MLRVAKLFRVWRKSWATSTIDGIVKNYKWQRCWAKEFTKFSIPGWIFGKRMESSFQANLLRWSTYPTVPGVSIHTIRSIIVTPSKIHTSSKFSAPFSRKFFLLYLNEEKRVFPPPPLNDTLSSCFGDGKFNIGPKCIDKAPALAHKTVSIPPGAPGNFSNFIAKKTHGSSFRPTTGTIIFISLEHRTTRARVAHARLLLNFRGFSSTFSRSLAAFDRGQTLRAGLESFIKIAHDYGRPRNNFLKKKFLRSGWIGKNVHLVTEIRCKILKGGNNREWKCGSHGFNKNSDKFDTGVKKFCFRSSIFNTQFLFHDSV